MPQEVELRRTRTRLLTTVVTVRQGRATWRHHVGRSAPEGFRPLLSRAPSGLTGVVFGAGDDRKRSYRTGTSRILPELLIAPAGIDFHHLGFQWGQALGTIHACDLPTSGTPRTAMRAEEWIHGQWTAVPAIIGGDGMSRVQQWFDGVLGGIPHTLHGSPGIAHWTLTADGTAGLLLTGEDLGRGSVMYDVVWILGELAELYAFYPAHRPNLEQVLKGFGEGYDGDWSGVSPGIAFRLIHHAYDRHHYAGASAQQVSGLMKIAQFYLNREVWREYANLRLPVAG